MFLAFKLTDIVTVPFGWLLSQIYNLVGNYGLAMILFAFLVQMILLPITMKTKQSTMKMSRLQPRIQEIQRKYADDKQKQNEAIQQLQKEEGVGLGCGGCLWSLVPLLILLPLFGVIREPIRYLLGESAENAELIVEAIRGFNPEIFSSNKYFAQIQASQYIPMYAEQLKAAVPGIAESTLQGINYNFLGINMGAQPVFNVFKWEAWTWANIGLFLIPVLSSVSQMLQMWISQKANNSVVTNDKGIQDEEVAKQSQSAQQNKTMMFMMPLITLYFGFSYPAGLSLYWFVGGVVRTVQDIILTKHYRKVYDEEDAARLARYQAQLEAEAEKERIRAERRAANPDGITANTSKKKLQQKQKEEEAASRAAAEAEYLAKKGIVVETEEEETTLSGIADRPNCKGRAYDPNRYDNTEEEE